MSATQPEPQTIAEPCPKTRRLILHAGMQKTGSTTIQHFLDGGVLRNARYFKGPKPNHSLLYLLLFGDNPESHRSHRLHGRSREETLKLRAAQLDALAAELDASDIATHVFSGERVSKSSRAEMERCRDFFARWFAEIEVYAYIRSPVKFAASMFQQHLKFGNMPTIENCLPNYRDRVGNLDAVFRRDHVHLRAFDAVDARIPDILPDFLDWTGLEVAGEIAGARNTSLSAEATALLYAVSRRLNRSLTSTEDVQQWNALVRRAQEIGDQKYAFDPALFGCYRAGVMEDHAWAEERLGQRFPDPRVPGSEQYRFKSLKEIRLLGLQVFKTVAGKPLDKREGDAPLKLKRVLRLLGAPAS